MAIDLDALDQKLEKRLDGLSGWTITGRVTEMVGMMLSCEGLESWLSIGSRCVVIGRHGERVMCEVVGFKDGHAQLAPYQDIQGIGVGCTVLLDESQQAIVPSNQWLGRVVDAFGRPLDGKGALPKGQTPYLMRAAPPPAHDRQRIGPPIDLGVAAINCFLTCCLGQRMGIFAGSGVGKSTLISMMACYSGHDVNVIGLIGERGREVQEFIEDYLGPEGMARSVIVVATSDESALMRRQAAYTTMAIAEFFRDQDKNVLCMMDSVTRFAMALREIGLSAGEPPTTRGYTPTVFAELPKLLERAGPGAKGKGMMTGLFSVLVEGDDTNEPIADAVRGILDGHIVLNRRIAERGRFPSIDILSSVSRTMPECHTEDQQRWVKKALAWMSTHRDMEDMIRLGAYKKGSDPMVDQSMVMVPQLEVLLSQDKSSPINYEASFQALARLIEPESHAG